MPSGCRRRHRCNSTPCAPPTRHISHHTSVTHSVRHTEPTHKHTHCITFLPQPPPFRCTGAIPTPLRRGRLESDLLDGPWPTLDPYGSLPPSVSPETVLVGWAVPGRRSGGVSGPYCTFLPVVPLSTHFVSPLTSLEWTSDIGKFITLCIPALYRAWLYPWLG